MAENSYFPSSRQTGYTGQRDADVVSEQHDSTVIFFGVGMFINVVLVTVYLIWAFRQWGKSGKRDE